LSIEWKREKDLQSERASINLVKNTRFWGGRKERRSLPDSDKKDVSKERKKEGKRSNVLEKKREDEVVEGEGPAGTLRSWSNLEANGGKCTVNAGRRGDSVKNSGK